MKYLLIVASLLSSSVFAQQKIYAFSYFKGNGEDGLHLAYSRDGYSWTALNKDSSFLKPTVANDKLMRDPCIIRGEDGKFHMVWTVSWNDKGIGYASSADLIHWSEQVFLPVMSHEPDARNCWAPEITYDYKSKLYMIYWATTIPGRFTAGDTSGDSKYNHRMYYVLTKDFKNFSDTKLLLDPGFNCIDATIIPDGKKFLMFIKDETRYPPQKNIRMGHASRIEGAYVLEDKPVTGNYWAEGPTLLKSNDRWLLFFDKYTEHTYGALESSNGKNWKDVSDKIQMPKGIRHGSVFEISEEELQNLFTKK